MRKIVTCTVLAALLASTSAFAAGNLVTNGSFEQGAVPSANSYGYAGSSDSSLPKVGTGSSDAVTGWTFNGAALSNSAQAWDPRGAVFSSVLGTVYAALQSNSSFYTKFTATATGAFSLLWYDAGRNYSGSYDGNQTYKVSVADSSHTLWSENYGTTTGSGPSYLTQLLNLVNGVQYTLTFTGTSSSGDHTAFIDGVSVTAVPGPIAAAGLPGLMALVGLGLYRRRQHVG
jgi:hypothetical protein